jgi:cardiolipin synthase C
MMRGARRWLEWGATAAVLVCAAGCASLPQEPPHAAREASVALPVSPDTPLGALAAQAAAHGGRSGFRALPQADFALDARVELLRRSQTSIDVQVYLIGDDATGHALLRGLRDAGARGVRVRLLVDDAHTIGLDPLLLGLAAVPNVEVRLYNPFTSGRGSAIGRAFNVAGDFDRLNHRMHNKLLVVDGALAIVGGRNMADEYFQRHTEANFLDFDVLALGPVVGELARLFDAYWNSPVVWPVQAVAGLASAQLRDAFDRQVAAPGSDPLTGLSATDLYGSPPLGIDLDQGLPRLIWADAQAYADAPDKRGVANDPHGLHTTVTGRTIESLREARSEVVLVSPYLVPGRAGLAHMIEARRQGVALRVVTNSMATTDERLVAAAYQRYRVPMLQAGIELYELSSTQLKVDRRMRATLGASTGSLHAKLAFIDRRTVLIGSMNLDPRSAWTNTELGVRIDSAELAAQIGGLPALAATRGAYRVTLAADGSGLRWTAPGAGDAAQVLDDEPEMGWAARLKATLLSIFVPEKLL